MKITAYDATGHEFPVTVTADSTVVTVTQLNLVRQPTGTEIVLALAWEPGIHVEGATVSIVAIVGFSIADPVTGTALYPRVYDDWGPIPWDERPESLVIRAPLAHFYWSSPDGGEVTLDVTV